MTIPDVPAPDEATGGHSSWVTWVLLGLCLVLFAAELMFPALPATGWLTPSVQTLVAWGGMSHGLVVEQGQWARLITAAFLHGGPGHLAMNAIALLIAGGTLERLIGRLWMLALFLLGAVGGGLASVFFNAPNIVGIGASGAIMALFGFFLTIAFRFDKGPVRRAFLVNGLGTLVPSLLPGLIPTGGFQIDYAAHAGGATVGAVLGLLFLLIWRKDTALPPLRIIAAAVIIAATLAVALSLPRLASDYAEARYAASLIPEADLPKTDAAARERADQLIRDFPNDPRGYFYRALREAARNEAAAAERDSRTALALADRHPDIFLQSFRARLRIVQALALGELGRTTDARQVAAPVCGLPDARTLWPVLQRQNLCP